MNCACFGAELPQNDYEIENVAKGQRSYASTIGILACLTGCAYSFRQFREAVLNGDKIGDNE
jgi:hypothetical protein